MACPRLCGGGFGAVGGGDVRASSGRFQSPHWLAFFTSVTLAEVGLPSVCGYFLEVVKLSRANN
jgi:hypothetical protein